MNLYDRIGWMIGIPAGIMAVPVRFVSKPSQKRGFFYASKLRGADGEV